MQLDFPNEFDNFVNCVCLHKYSVRFDVNMNPICQTDINNPECQQWMTIVCEHCKKLYKQNTSDALATLWHDNTPPIYKIVADMTVYDCLKLKNLLEKEVDALQSIPKTSMKKSIEFRSWQTIILISVYIVIIVIVVLILCFWNFSIRRCQCSEDEEKMNEQETMGEGEAMQGSNTLTNAPGTSTETVPQRFEPGLLNLKNKIKLKEGLGSWIRRKAGPYFVHNESTLRRQQIKSKETKRLKEISTQEKIEKWTKMREKLAEKAKEKSLKTEQKGQGRAK